MGLYTYIDVIFSLYSSTTEEVDIIDSAKPRPSGSAALHVCLPSLTDSQSLTTAVNALVADWSVRMTAPFGLGE